MSKSSHSTEDFIKQLTLIVGKKQLLLADNTEDQARMLPFLEESRGRYVGQAMAIIFPSSTAEVAKVVATCRFHKRAMVVQGGNTGRCLGAQSNDRNAVVINLKNLNKIREFDADNMTITVEAGCILQTIQAYVAERGLYFPLSLGAEGSCQIGGNLATNAGGVNVLRYGNTRDLTLGVEAVISNGTVLNELYGLRKNNTGYDLKNLLIGSEGTLGIITAATLKLYPPERVCEHGFIAVNSVSDALLCLQRLKSRFADKISTFELLPHLAIQLLEKHSRLRCPIANGHAWYIWYRLADSYTESSLFDDNLACLETLMAEGIVVDATVAQNEGMKQLFEQIRETIVEVQKMEGYSVKFDVSVPVSAIPLFIEKSAALLCECDAGYRPYPFGHVGDGNIHYNVFIPDGQTEPSMLDRHNQRLSAMIYDVVDGLSGSFSAEHGIGRLKVEVMQQYKDPVALDMMRRVKQAFDPFNLMNPGKVIPPLSQKR